MAVTMVSFDATSPPNNPTECAVEYQVPALKPGEVHVLDTYFTVQEDVEVIFFEGHQHIGGINVTVGIAPPGTKDPSTADFKPFCTATAGYGNGTEPGNEDGYLVAISTCSWNTSPIKIPKGSLIGIASYYSGRHLAGGHSYHEGVMGLGFVALLGDVEKVYNSFVIDKSSTYLKTNVSTNVSSTVN